MLEEAKLFTVGVLNTLRDNIEKAISDSEYKDDICVVVTGSYGRLEASEESDIDWYVIFDKDRDVSETIGVELDIIRNEINKLIPNEHGDTGVFGENAVVKFSEMQTNIGGSHDSNVTLTRRMLFLLEGSYLYNEGFFQRLRLELLKKYIKSTDSKENIPRFLLNDIIRYYRTITTDFEYKISEGDKEWGLRNIKLKFSRKLLYFSGVIAVAQLDNLVYEKRLDKAEELFSIPPLERIRNVIGSSSALGMYEEFLNIISDKSSREALETVNKTNRIENHIYGRLNDISGSFSEELHKLIKQEYPEDKHPLQHSLVF